MMSSYNDEYHVIHGLVGKFLAVQRQERASHNSISCVSDALTNCRRQLRSIEGGADMREKINDQVWIHLAKLRLDKQTLDSWERFRNQHCRELPTCEEFQSFLETRAKGRREYEPDIDWASSTTAKGRSGHDSVANRSKPYDRDGQRARSGGHDQNRQTKCAVPGCNETHPAWRCELFGHLPLTQRRELSDRHRLCRCCLGSGHLAGQCPRQGCAKCPDARFKHYFKLCPKTTDDSGSATNAFKRTAEPNK